MSKKRQLYQNIIFLLFNISISATLIPCGIINSVGMFGEVTSSTIVNAEENEENLSEQECVKVHRIKSYNNFNIWLLLRILVIFLIYLVYEIKLPTKETIVTLKVRMDE